MSHLQRISWILGTLLLGVSAALVYQREENTRAANQLPVEALAENLKHAWAGYHTP